jgi:N-acetylmuramoyl-L-alanine amidase
MNLGAKFFHKSFAVVSLGFVFIAAAAISTPLRAATSDASTKQEAATSQFARAEELRALLNSKPSEQRTLAEYKKVLTGYQRVYMITPRALEVADALFAVAELDTEMGDHFGRNYYQNAADTYAFLIHDYPTSKHVADAMLRLGSLQKDQLGDLASAGKTFQEFEKKFPHSPHKREAQEALAEISLRRSAETGESVARNSVPPAAAPTPVKVESAAPALSSSPAPDLHKTLSGGEPARLVAVPRVQKIRTNVTADSTEVIIDLEDSVQFVSGRITNPDRIYFDLHAARLAPAVAKTDVHVSGELLTKVRVAQNQSGVVRVVLDVDGVKDYAVSLTKKPTRLVIELYSSVNRGKSSPTETAKNTKSKPSGVATQVAEADVSSSSPIPTAANSEPVAGTTEATTTAPIAKALPEPSKTSLTKPANSKSKPDLVQPVAAPMPTRDGQSTLTRTLGLKINRIVIDAGHGGHDTGTIGPTGLMEKDLCLDVALRLGKIIEQKLPGADVVYTRSDDTFIPLEERTRIANEAKADLFVSIHANSSPDHGARGVETYYLNLKGSPDAMEVAARENAVSQEGIHDLEDIVKRIARTEKIDESKELAEDVQDSLSKRIQKTAKPVRDRGVRKAPFVVLIGADMPSILTEISFLSNPADEQLLKKPDHRQHIAEGVYQGVSSYLQSLNSMAADSSPRPNHAPVVATVEQSRNQK